VKVWGGVSENFPNGCQIAEVEIDPDTGGVVIADESVGVCFLRIENPEMWTQSPLPSASSTVVLRNSPERQA
jgi:hypothetical protein